VAVKVIKRTETQTGTRKVKKIRKNGYVPAVLYGQEMEATPLVVGAEPGYKRTYNVRTFIGT